MKDPLSRTRLRLSAPCDLHIDFQAGYVQPMYSVLSSPCPLDVSCIVFTGLSTRSLGLARTDRSGSSCLEDQEGRMGLFVLCIERTVKIPRDPSMWWEKVESSVCHLSEDVGDHGSPFRSFSGQSYTLFITFDSWQKSRRVIENKTHDSSKYRLFLLRLKPTRIS